MAMASRLRSLPVASVRRLCSGSGGGGATLSALIERLPVVTPELSEWEVEWREAREALVISRAKVYNAEFTAAEEGPERTRARLRLEQVVESMGGRQGEGDTTGDESSMDRKLAERVYLLLQAEDGSWGLPQQPWAPPARARDGLQALIAASCGDELQTHQVGNTPAAHLGELFVWRFQHVQGEVVPAAGTHAWLTKQELAERLGGPLGALALQVCDTLP